MTPASVLRAAAALIEHEGWTQGVLRNYATGARCAYGAIFDVTIFHPVTPQQTELLDRAHSTLLDFLHMKKGLSVSAWNDDPSRTQAEVITTLRAAADQAEAAK